MASEIVDDHTSNLLDYDTMLEAAEQREISRILSTRPDAWRIKPKQKPLPCECEYATVDDNGNAVCDECAKVFNPPAEEN